MVTTNEIRVFQEETVVEDGRKCTDSVYIGFFLSALVPRVGEEISISEGASYRITGVRYLLEGKEMAHDRVLNVNSVELTVKGI